MSEKNVYSGLSQSQLLEEKQRLRIAMISPPTENFEGFDECIKACPMDALLLTDGRPVFLPLRCIGCGACVVASNGRIRIYGVTEQRTI